MMLPRTYEGQTCSIARALEIVGERWTLLLVRDALLGVRRFEDFCAGLGIPRNILAVRLDLLVTAGLLRREAYSDHPVRHEYVPTDKALDLRPVLLALGQWGARHGDAAGVTREFLQVESGTPGHALA